MKESRENKVNTVKWDEKWFINKPGCYWEYFLGILVNTNMPKSKLFVENYQNAFSLSKISYLEVNKHKIQY